MKKFVIISQSFGKTSGGCATLMKNFAEALNTKIYIPVNKWNSKKYLSKQAIAADFNILSEILDKVIFFNLNDLSARLSIAQLIIKLYDVAIIYPGTLIKSDLLENTVYYNFINKLLSIKRLIAILLSNELRVYSKVLFDYNTNLNVIGYVTLRNAIKNQILNKKSYAVNNSLPWYIIPNCINILLFKLLNIDFQCKINNKVVVTSRFGSSKRPKLTIIVLNRMIHNGLKLLLIYGWSVKRLSGSITFLSKIKKQLKVFKMFKLNIFDLIKMNSYGKDDIKQIYRNASFLLDLTYIKHDECIMNLGGLQYIDLLAIKNGVIPIMNCDFCKLDSDLILKIDSMLKQLDKLNHNVDCLVNKMNCLTADDRIEMIKKLFLYIKKYHSFLKLTEILSLI